jgi:heme-degrading monooxygenase HmoA
MHAVVVIVKIDPQGDREAALKDLKENVVPGVSRAPGFISGVWLAPDDTGKGLSIVTFDTEDNAKAAASRAQEMFDSGQTPPGVKLDSIGTREVAASA